MSGIFNHLWQSTAFTLVVALAALALQRNSPRLRYWLWFAASMKFLIPFSLLVSVGARIPLPPITPSLQVATAEHISIYFEPLSVLPSAAPSREEFPWFLVLVAVWLTGALFLLFRWFRRWRTIYLAARRAARLPSRHSVPIFSSPAMMEPGVFGFFRPVLLLPKGISDNLTSAQFEAILTHELRHIQCFDTLTAVLHMCVETLFWFYPLVWWIGAKLMNERERDCDEAVLRQGSEPADYARGIVQVCQTYVESKLPCAPGISGSDLKKRVREIMTWRGSLPVTSSGKGILASVAVAAVSVPFVIGVMRAQTMPGTHNLLTPAYSYDEVSIHRSTPGQPGMSIGPGPQGGLSTTNTPVMRLLMFAYGVRKSTFVGAPDWVSADPFDISFMPDKAETLPSRGMSIGSQPNIRNLQRVQAMLQAVLSERFGLVLRAETRELPIYALTQAKNGNKLSHSDDGGPGSNVAKGDTIKYLAGTLSDFLERPVVDETGLAWLYDLKLEWYRFWNVPAALLPDELKDYELGSNLTALTEQYGLQLVSKKGPATVYVIDKINQPSEN